MWTAVQAGFAPETPDGDPATTLNDLNDIQLRWMRLCDIESKREMMGGDQDGDLPDLGKIERMARQHSR